MFNPLICGILMSSYLFLFLQPKVRGEPLATNDTCGPIRIHLVESIISRITLLPNLSPVDLDCKSISKINSLEENSILLTTTSKRGKEYICLHAGGSPRPCQVKIGIVTSQENPDIALCKLTQQDCSDIFEGPLTETVERLFLKPSLLIQ